MTKNGTWLRVLSPATLSVSSLVLATTVESCAGDGSDMSDGPFLVFINQHFLTGEV